MAMAHGLSDMDLDAEEKNVFADLLGKRPLQLATEQPPDPHPAGKGGSNGQKAQPSQLGRRQRQPAPAQGSRGKDDRRGHSNNSLDDHAMLNRVAKALVVQSDYLARLQSDHTVIFTFRNGHGPQLMVPGGELARAAGQGPGLQVFEAGAAPVPGGGDCHSAATKAPRPRHRKWDG